MTPGSSHGGFFDTDHDADEVGEKRSDRRRRTRRPWRMIALSAVLIVIVAVVGVDLARGESGLILAGPADPGTSPEPSAEPSVPPEESTQAPAAGTGKFGFAKGDSKVSGSKGKLLRYRVAVEKGSEQDLAGFASEVKAILGGENGWTGTGKHRFQRVGENGQRDFTIYLATAATSKKMCAAGGLHTDGYLSCRLGGQVIINLDRWLTGVADYGAPLEQYRAFALNHEIGHQLGNGHEACPRAGEPAPVMQQQSLGLDGCTPFGWPLRDGELYSGVPIP